MLNCSFGIFFLFKLFQKTQYELPYNVKIYPYSLFTAHLGFDYNIASYALQNIDQIRNLSVRTAHHNLVS